MMPAKGMPQPGNTVLQQPDELSLLNPAPLSGDSIAFALDSSVAGLFFTDYLQVVYTGKEAPAAHLDQAQGQKPGYLTSQLLLLQAKPLQVFSNGSYYHPANLLSSGYWGWAEKRSSLLPFDYRPGWPE